MVNSYWMSFSEECLTAVSPVKPISWAATAVTADTKIMLTSFFTGLDSACFDNGAT